MVILHSIWGMHVLGIFFINLLLLLVEPFLLLQVLSA